jgi:hypothetical protein
MAEYNGVSATTRADIVKMNTSLSRVVPEQDQRNRQREPNSENQADASPTDKQDGQTDEHGLEFDPSLQAFNAFLEKDSIDHLEHRQEQPVSTINQIRALTGGHYGYDEVADMPVPEAETPDQP